MQDAIITLGSFYLVFRLTEGKMVFDNQFTELHDAALYCKTETKISNGNVQFHIIESCVVNV